MLSPLLISQATVSIILSKKNRLIKYVITSSWHLFGQILIRRHLYQPRTAHKLTKHTILISEATLSVCYYQLISDTRHLINLYNHNWPSLSSHGRHKWLNNDILMSAFCQNLSNGTKVIKMCQKPNGENRNISPYLQNVNQNGQPSDILTTWHSVLSLHFHISVFHSTKVVSVVLLSTRTEELQGKGPVYKRFTLDIKSTDGRLRGSIGWVFDSWPAQVMIPRSWDWALHWE